MRPQFVVPIHDLDAAGRDFETTVASSWLADQLRDAESELAPSGPDGRLAVHVSRSGNDVVVRGRLQVDLKIPCARCLEPMELHPDLELSLLLVPATGTRGSVARGAAPPRAHRGADGRGRPDGGQAKGKGKASARDKEREEETELAPEDADLDTYEGEEVVLDRFVREAVLLEEPIFPLCSETCEGIPPPPAFAEPHPSSPFAGLSLRADGTQAPVPSEGPVTRAKKPPKE